MKKFLGVLILIIAMQVAKSQCTAFLGPDKQYMPCSNPFALNTDSIFQEPATTTFQQQQLPAFDTIFGVGGTIDTLIPLTIKVMYTATRTDGCTDVCIVGVAIRRWPIPELGPDTCINLGFQQETMDINARFINKITFISGYNHHTWSTPTPQDVDTGFYWVKVVTHDGCSDVLNICVRCAVKRDTVVKMCEGDKYNLTSLFVKSGYTNLWKTLRFVQGDTINTANAAAVDTGRYMLLSSKPGRCTDTMMVKVQFLPRLNLGPDRSAVKCFGSTLDATREFLLTGLSTQWNIPDATKANIGNHRLIATNSYGCKDTAFIEIRDTTKPEIGPDQFEFICPTDNPINLNSNFILNNLFPEWNTPNPTAVQAAGTYQLIAQNEFGCKDSANFTIFHFEKPDFLRDTTITLCFGHTKDLNTIYTIPNGYSFVDWSTATPSTAGAGQHIITVSDNNQGCNFTAVVTVKVQPNDAGQLAICHYTQSTTGGTFTTNHFRTINVDKRGHIWAGSENGGLYRFTPLNGTACGGTWQKNIPTSGITAGINRYKDIQISNIIGDTSIWAASQGHSHPQDITGGIDHVTDLNAPIQHYGSVNVPMSTQLGSRNVNSLTIGNSGKIYAALGQSIQNDTSANGGGTFIILEGGFYHNDLTNLASDFTKFLPNQPLDDIRITSTGKRGDNKIWFNVDKSCDPIGGCSNPYILEILDSTNLVTNIWNEFNSVIPTARPGLLVTAIFTASDGRTYVGMNDSVGIAVLEPEEPGTTPNWTLVNTDNSPLPYNARINFNAISEVNGEIWFGTSRGLLVYNGVGPLTECASYTLYTTANGLPSNNITDVVFDTNTFDVWLTTDNGIVKIIVDPRILGTVYNVSAGRYDALQPELTKIPLKDALVKLIQTSGPNNGFLIESKVTDSTGYFEFSQVKPFTSYKVEVDYVGKYQYNYRFSNLKYNSIIGDILIPDSLSIEMDTLKLKMEKHKFPFEIFVQKYDTLFFITELLRTAEGYVLDKYKEPFIYLDTSVVTSNHLKRVENIANYYMNLATVYTMGLAASELKLKQYESFVDAIEALVETGKTIAELTKLLKPANPFAGTATGTFATDEEDEEEPETPIKDFIKSIAGIVGEKMKTALITKIENIKIDGVDSIELKKAIKEFTPYLSQGIDLIASVITEGAKDVVLDKIKETIKKGFLIFFTKLDYTNYCQELHQNLIPNVAQYATMLNSDLSYANTFKLIQDTLTITPEKSLNKQVIDTLAFFNKQIDELKENSETAELISGGIKATAEIATIAAPIIGAAVGSAAGGIGAFPGLIVGFEVGQKIAKVLKGLEALVGGFKTYELFNAAYTGFNGNKVIRKISRYVVPTSGFTSSSISYSADQQMFTTASLDSLVAKKNRYNQRVSELNSIISLPYDSATYYSKFLQYKTADSAYRSEITNTRDLILPKANNAITNIAAFENKYTNTFQNLVDAQYNNQFSFGLLQLAYQLNPYNDTLKRSIDTVKNRTISSTNAATSGLEELVDLINTNNIPAPAYLIQTGYNLQFNNRPNSNGTITYTLKNVGNVAQTNVTAQITQPTGGFAITSSPLLNFGTVAPGQSIQLVYQFTAPNVDTSGNYQIIINAGNGQFNNLSGTLVTLLSTQVTSKANGFWSNPATWSTNRVPNTNSNVIVKHNVEVDVITAITKSIKVMAPGTLKVKAGMKFSVRK
jgi:hypothetical protein